MTAPDKAKLLGLFLWLFTVLNVVVIVALGVVWIAMFGVIFSTAPHKANDPPPELIFSIVAFVFVFLLIFTVLFSIPKIVAGYGLRKERSWARTWAIVASVMCCLSFPIGTAIGVFGLVFLFSDEGKQYFENRSYGRLGMAGGMPPPPPPSSWQ